MRKMPLGILVAALLSAVEGHAEIHTVTWSAKAATVVNQPFGLAIPFGTVVSGYFTFDTSTTDTNISPQSGEYPHTTHAGFLAKVLGTNITGSLTPFYWVDLAGNTFRIYDGPRTVGKEGGVMSVDGVPDSTIELFVAITDDVFDSDAFINPFPLYNFGFLGTPHTFSLKDDQGTLLMQISSVAEAVCGDTNGSGVSASDALQVLKASVGTRECLPCVCDVDAGGTITASDALKTLRFAVGGKPVLQCSLCL